MKKTLFNLSILLVFMVIFSQSFYLSAENDYKKVGNSVYYTIPTKSEFQKKLELKKELRELYNLSNSSIIEISIDEDNSLLSLFSFPGTEIGHSHVVTPSMIPGNQHPSWSIY